MEAYDATLVSAYSAFPTMFRRPWRDCFDVTAETDIAFLGLPFDRSTNHRPGARYGPRAVRGASLELWWGDVWPWGFDPFQHLNAVDVGDAAHPNGRHDEFFPRAEHAARALVEAGAVPFAIGGDHSTTLAMLRAVAGRHGPLALVQFDAHADTAVTEQLTHGSVIRYAIDEGLVDPERTLQVGVRTPYDESLGIHVWSAAEIHDLGGGYVRAFRERLKRSISGPTYVTVDIDGLDPAFAPGTGTPTPGGLSTGVLLAMLRDLRHVDIVGSDVVEVAPDLDPTGWTTALAAATAQLEVVCALAARRKKQPGETPEGQFTQFLRSGKRSL